jgi:hypothetical protein
MLKDKMARPGVEKGGKQQQARKKKKRKTETHNTRKEKELYQIPQ